MYKRMSGVAVTPLKYSGVTRPAKLKANKALLRRKIIDADQFNVIVKALNREERKAIKRREKADAIWEKKEAERIKAEQEAYLKKEAEREAKRLISKEKAKEKRRAKRQAEKTEKGDTLISLTYSYRFNYKNDKEGTPMRTAIVEASVLVSQYADGSKDPITDAIDMFLMMTADKLHQYSPIILYEWDLGEDVYDNILKWHITSQMVVAPANKDKNKIKMKDAFALDLDGTEFQHWDSKQGCCVYDFLIWRYGKVKGGKRICTYEGLDNIFGEKARIEGVSVYDLEPICDKLRIRMYAMDEMKKIIHTYAPKAMSINNDAPPLIFMVKDNHFYAILDKSKSICQMGKDERRTELQQEVPKGKKKEKEEVEVEIAVVGDNQTHLEFMVQEMRKHQRQVYPFKNISMSSSGLQSFVLDGKKYLFEEDHTIQTAQKIVEKWGETYKGETVNGYLVEALTELKYDTRSAYNPKAFEVITDPNVKWRTHYGTVGDISGGYMLDLLQNGGAICADITKAYTACVENPMTEWLLYDFNDEWSPQGTALPDGEIPTGLYYVDTEDMTLLHSTNIYSDAILNLARKEGIHFTILSQYIPSKTLPKDYYAPLIQRFNELTKGDVSLKKVLLNTFTGFLGKHKTERYIAKMNTDADVVWNDFSTDEFHKYRTFMYKVDEFYIYGYIVPTINAENNIPQYIQILDWSNIRLYNMIKESKGKVLWRKTDCAIIEGGSLPFKGDDAKPGDYRVSPYPDTFKAQMTCDFRAVEVSPFERDFDCVKSIRSSSQIDEVFNLLMERKALVNVSRAGTGKSYNLLAVEQKFMEKFPDAKVVKLAFTNKACLNIRGTTIHKFLKLNSAGKFNIDWLKSMAQRDMLIEIDEISMIGSFLWRRLVELKKALPKAYFLLCGDYRQVPPVEAQTDIDYFDCSALKYLASHTKIEFVERQRYDADLWAVAENLWENGVMDFGKVTVLNSKRITATMLEGKYNICYYNSTRKRINSVMNSFIGFKHTHKVKLPFKEESEDGDDISSKAIQQDATIYKGLPIIAHKNHYTEDDDEDGDAVLETANNETFTVTNFDDTTFTAMSYRTNDDGVAEEHIITLPLDEFHNRFLLNYCATTHKSQGATITDDIVLWDFNEMTRNLKYTAITRAKKISQIHIVL